MVDKNPSVSIPAFPYFCNLVVFPATTNECKFYILKKSSFVPETILGKISVEYEPGSVYCLLPSYEKSCGSVSVYKSRPSFLSEYNYCLEINVNSVDFLSCNLDTVSKTETLSSQLSEAISFKKCSGCFVSHFPRPNTSQCRWKKNIGRVAFVSKCSGVRLRGGANEKEGPVIIDRAVSNAKFHGINIHAGVKNLGNGNCVFETIIDTVNTRDSFQETHSN